MKRFLLIGLGVVVLLVVLLAAAVRLPATQRWALRHAVASVPGLDLEAEHVSIGLGSAELRGIDATVEGTTIRLPAVRASYDGWALVSRHELIVRELVATDLAVVLATGSAAPAEPAAKGRTPAVAKAFGGLLAPLQLPLKATVEGVQLAGRVQLDAAQSAAFSAQGRLLVPGREAAVDLQLEWRDSGGASLAAALDWVGRITTTARATGEIDRVQVEGTLAVPKSAGSTTEQGIVTAAVAARDPRTLAETLTVTARLSTAKEKDRPLASLALAYTPGADHVSGDWSLNLRREQLDGIVDRERLPEFNTEAQGSFAVAAATGDLTAEGALSLSASKLQRVRKEFSTVGALVGKLDFAVAIAGDAVKVGRLELAVNDASTTVLKIAALQPVEYNLATGNVAYAQPTQDLVGVVIANLPLVWAQPWLADAKLGGAIRTGEIRVKGAGTAWRVETARPLAFAGVRLVSGGDVLADQLGGELSLKAGVDGTAWTVEALSLALRGGPADAATAVGLQLAAQQDAQGAGRANLPLTVEVGGRRSTLTLAGEWTLGGAVPKVSARITGDTIYLRDLAGLAAFVPKTETVPAAPKRTATAKAKAPAAAKDTRAFWAVGEARAEANVKRLVLDAEEVTGLQATLVCDAQKLTLERLTARANKAPLDAKVGVTFDAAKPVPYALTGTCTFPGFDLGAWMRAANPDEEPAIETVLDITAKLAGQGSNLDDLVAGVRGEFVLKGGAGVLRIKDRKVEAASQLGGLVLGLLAKEKQQKASVAAGSQLLEELREFRFQQLDVSLLRGDDMDLQFRAIDVRSAEKRLSGSGVAKHVAGGTIDDYPLQLEMRLAGKDNFAALLGQARLLDGSKDELGYLKMREPFTVTGTVGNPSWKKMLAQLAAGLALGK